MLPIIFLLGPTASGKTALALDLVQHFPLEIISVDSAMVYRGMDIGTSKPSPEILRNIPHHLIDIADPSEAYSAGQFRRDALRLIEEIIARDRIPFLVGGTMLYFSVLQRGLAEMPHKDEKIRTMLEARGEREGWQVLHQELLQVDPEAAARIHPSDAQRIQRALEVFLATGKPLSAWHQESTEALAGYQIHALGLIPNDRLKLHQRIAIRFQEMLANGFVAEVEQLFARGDLSPELPAIRSVGYSQIWAYLLGEYAYADMQDKAIAATRQLAKRQLTWLRSWENLTRMDPQEDNLELRAREWVRGVLFAKKHV